MDRFRFFIFGFGLVSSLYGLQKAEATGFVPLVATVNALPNINQHDQRQMNLGGFLFVREGDGIVVGKRDASRRGFSTWRKLVSLLESRPDSSKNPILDGLFKNSRVWYLDPELALKIKAEYEQGLVRECGGVDSAANSSNLDHEERKAKSTQQQNIFNEAVRRVADEEDLSGYHPSMRHGILAQNETLWIISPIEEDGFYARQIVWHFNEGDGQHHHFIVSVPDDLYTDQKMPLTQAAEIYKNLMDLIEEISGVNLEAIEKPNLRTNLMELLTNFVDPFGI